MRFWVRELAGWLLVLFGLFLLYWCFAILLSDRSPILSAGPLTVIAIFVFRGGIHLLKVAVAARICLQANAAVREQSAVAERPPARRAKPERA